MNLTGKKLVGLTLVDIYQQDIKNFDKILGPIIKDVWGDYKKLFDSSISLSNTINTITDDEFQELVDGLNHKRSSVRSKTRLKLYQYGSRAFRKTGEFLKRHDVPISLKKELEDFLVNIKPRTEDVPVTLSYLLK